jgi:methionine sulfoxide reductase heme-binding subunit
MNGMKKFIFFAILILLLLLVPITALRVTPLSLVLKNSATLTNYIQRDLGLFAFTLMFVQILLGAFMDKLQEKIGGWIFNFHVFEGGLVYTLALVHPLFLILFNHYVGIGWDPYRVFINVCLLCQTPLLYYYTLGMISFWLLTLAVFGGVFRSASPWLKAHWRKLHIINYIVFLVVGLHGFLIGTDFRYQPFYSFALVAYALVAGVVIFIELPRLYKNFRDWLKD